MDFSKIQQQREEFLDIAISGKTERSRTKGLFNLLEHINNHERVKSVKTEVIITMIAVSIRLYPDKIDAICDHVLDKCEQRRQEIRDGDYGALNSEFVSQSDSCGGGEC